MVATIENPTKEFQGTIHLQTRVQGEHRGDAADKLQKVRAVLEAEGIALDAFSVPLVRDMEEERGYGRHSTVLVAFDVASSSSSTANCVGHEAAGNIQAASDVERTKSHMADELRSLTESVEYYRKAAADYREQGLLAEAQRYGEYADQQQKQHAVVASALETVKQRHENGEFSQGRIVEYRVIGIEEGRPLPQPVNA